MTGILYIRSVMKDLSTEFLYALDFSTFMKALNSVNIIVALVHSHFQPVFRPQAVEVRGIHHRANHSFCAKGRFCRIFGRNLRKFKEKLKSEG
ncbi:hypothetical protein Prudu_797S000100 [Prunus dulcis]|uniref:Uncharacterized protein n=1 Tax=Prunus dulcis TaxID=3755 RepID=A0A5H2XM34_PRUDU|nr:hypothetical protein Prudu_797S000100 [Prunus dulcis]